jgi:chromate transporter
VFYGVGASVIGIIAMSAYKLTTKSVGKDKLLWAIYLVSAGVTVVTQSEELWVFLGGGALVWVLRARPGKGAASRLNGVALAAVPVAGSLVLGAFDWHRLEQIAAFFAYAGSFVFGSGLAIVPFLYGGVVKEYGWLTDRQFVDAVAVAMITPGPVVITTGFIGYLVSGFWGALVAALATFLPCYLFTVIPAPYFKKHGKRPGIVAFVDGVTAATIGAIAGAVVVLAQRSIIDWVTALLALATAAILWRFKKLPEPLIVVAAALIGLAAHPLMR